MDSKSFSSIVELSELIRSRQISPVDIVTTCLERIEQLNPTLNCFITVLKEHAMRQARKAEDEINTGHYLGPLHGIPIAVKDFFDTAGIRTTAASEHFKNRIPKKNAVVVEKLLAAGAILVGKTNMHTLGMGTTSLESYFGPVHNPWNPEYVAGGSSGGSAAAVATGLCYATVDTDAVGSCRIPAACCGVTGFKGSYGLISGRGILDGEKADESILKLSHVGITTRYAADTVLMLDVLAEPGFGWQANSFDAGSDSSPGKKTVRLGIVKNYKGSDEVRQAFTNACSTLDRLAYLMSSIDVPFDEARFDKLQAIEAVRKNIASSLFAEVDALLLPTLVDTAPTVKAAEKMGAQAVDPQNTFFANYYGLPALTIPCGFDKKGIPIGFQIVGPTSREDIVLKIAMAFQGATNFHLQHPDF